MSRASNILALVEKKKSKTTAPQPLNLGMLKDIFENIQVASELINSGVKVTNQVDILKINNCLMGMKGTSGKVRELVEKAKEQQK